MQAATRVLAGDCSITYERDERVEKRGAVVVLIKPDDTVLIHDSEGYQPAAWLTRADLVRFKYDENGFRVVAGKGEEELRVVSETVYGRAHFPASPTGEQVGECPGCEGALVRDGGRVVCVNCRARYGLPRDAAVKEETCSCGLPRIETERGAAFEVCLDRECESLDEAVKERFEGHWYCPDCELPMEIERSRGLRASCDCGRSHVIPTGVVVGECDCGLPVFDTPSGTRCLNPDCPRGP